MWTQLRLKLFIFLLFGLLSLFNCATITLKDGELEKLDRSKVLEGMDPSIAAVVPPNCNSCKEYLDIVTKLDANNKYNGGVYVVRSNSVPLLPMVKAPTLMIFNAERILPYKGKLEMNEIISFARQFTNGIQAARLTDSNFEHDTQASTGATTGDWLIVFDAMTSDSLKHYDGLALGLRARGFNLGIVDNSEESKNSKRFGVAKNGKKMFLLKKGSMYTYNKNFDYNSAATMIEFASTTYSKYPTSLVPRPVKPFDEFVDFVVRNVKLIEDKYGRDRMMTIGAGVAGLFVALLIILLVTCIYCCRKPKTTSTSRATSRTTASRDQTTTRRTRSKTKKD